MPEKLEIEECLGLVEICWQPGWERVSRELWYLDFESD
jgi:hypothetical protein